MTQITEQILNQAMQLSPHEREELAEQLYLSLHESAERQDEVDSAWSGEIARRLEQVDARKVSLLSADEVHHSIDRILKGE